MRNEIRTISLLSLITSVSVINADTGKDIAISENLNVESILEVIENSKITSEEYEKVRIFLIENEENIIIEDTTKARDGGWTPKS